MPVIPESEWQKKFNKTSSQDTKETWQNKFKKPSWQQELGIWTDRCVKKIPSGYVYKPINKNDYITRAAVVLDDGLIPIASYFFKIYLSLKKDGTLSVFVRANTALQSFPRTTVVWLVTAIIKVNGKIILRDTFKNIPGRPEILPNDNFVKIGYVETKLPEPSGFGKTVLILTGGYELDTDQGKALPEPPTVTKEYLLDIERLHK